MKTLRSRLQPAHASLAKILAAFLSAALAAPAGATDIPINSRATYLHVCSDAAANTVPIVLADLGIVPGESLLLEVLGDWDNGPGGDTFISTVAVFSGSATLLGPSLLNRVQDAIAAGTPTFTANTFFCNEPTDIPEDFRVATSIPNTSVVVEVPAGATHLFVCASDHHFSDNSDPDGDYAIRITKEPVQVKGTTWGAIKALYWSE